MQCSPAGVVAIERTGRIQALFVKNVCSAECYIVHILNGTIGDACFILIIAVFINIRLMCKDCNTDRQCKQCNRTKYQKVPFSVIAGRFCFLKRSAAFAAARSSMIDMSAFRTNDLDIFWIAAIPFGYFYSDFA